MKELQELRKEVDKILEGLQLGLWVAGKPEMWSKLAIPTSVEEIIYAFASENGINAKDVVGLVLAYGIEGGTQKWWRLAGQLTAVKGKMIRELVEKIKEVEGGDTELE